MIFHSVVYSSGYFRCDWKLSETENCTSMYISYCMRVWNSSELFGISKLCDDENAHKLLKCIFLKFISYVRQQNPREHISRTWSRSFDQNELRQNVS
ncbi:hypothetical protein NY2A_b864R [Paramecium bursaria Chlorella virus NY2A]|uniref:Uncharacterized protein b864R n=1 Tax=Paramecium bursaria Chlorella virus NY2A TaxID=46021 RepID=A7IY39_PBCVN|nr:hypothetical protein NY2A_b864R [Paramecium bursaria Chlorella virus NY2A]ABT15263.1 hypothetical protein NY2A_b864R [Paramecium bursaria Chlorella virus NY2A]